jgi:hypothetical protein
LWFTVKRCLFIGCQARNKNWSHNYSTWGKWRSDDVTDGVVSNKTAKKIHPNRYHHTTGTIDTQTTQIYDSSRYWFDTATSVKRGWVKLVT